MTDVDAFVLGPDTATGIEIRKYDGCECARTDLY